MGGGSPARSGVLGSSVFISTPFSILLSCNTNVAFGRGRAFNVQKEHGVKLPVDPMQVRPVDKGILGVGGKDAVSGKTGQTGDGEGGR